MMRMPAAVPLVPALLVLSGCRLAAGAPPATPAVPKPPAISETSTAKNLAAYVAYYEGLGYKVTTNQQSYGPDGKLQAFRFAATRRRGTASAGVKASINAATHTVTTAVSSSSTTKS